MGDAPLLMFSFSGDDDARLTIIRTIRSQPKKV
jgi:hypothetical protein